MDDRLRGVEGDVGTLKDWRSRTVDPWISSGKEFRETVGSYITTLKAKEEIKEKLDDERHANNSFKLTFILVIATVGLLIVATLSLWVAFQTMKHTLAVPLNLHGSTSVLADSEVSTIPPLAR